MATNFMEDEVVYSTGRNAYKAKEKQCSSKYNRRCIDGKVVGSGKCVGYCNYFEHNGFLTEKLRKEHECIEKKCRHYIDKACKDANIITIADLCKGNLPSSFDIKN